MAAYLSHGLFFAYAAVLVGGLLTALTPCVYPLIPITVSIFGARQATKKAQAAALSACYILGIAVTYTGLGLAAAASGTVFGRIMANPWVVGGVVLVFLAFAASMFGAFELALPASLQGRLSQVGGKGFLGALAMGLVAGLIAAPCTGPVLGAILAYVATTQKMALGGTLLFVYALGMGLPFFVIGTFAVSLPKSGPWMDAVKSIFGIAMILVALHFLAGVVPALGHAPSSKWVMAAVVVAVLGGTLLGAIHRSFHGSLGEKLSKGLGVALVVVGVQVGIASASGPSMPSFTPDEWLHRETTVLAEARAQHKPVLIDFGADWCAACKELEHDAYPHPAVAAQLDRFVFVKVDETKPTKSSAKIEEKYGVSGLPYVVLIDSQGQVLKDKSFTGFKPPSELAGLLSAIN